MLKSINKHKIDFVWTAFFALLFALVRFFENELFYDPFLSYFKNDYLSKTRDNIIKKLKKENFILKKKIQKSKPRW